MSKIEETKCIYVILNTENGRIKIGMSSNVSKRFEALKYSGGCKLELLYNTLPVVNAYIFESRLHKIFSEYRYIGEWFTVDFTTAIDMIKKLTVDYEICGVCEMFRSGVNPSNIAKEYNVSRSCIVNHLAVRGFKPRFSLNDKIMENEKITALSKSEFYYESKNNRQPPNPITKLNISDMVAKNNQKLQMNKALESQRLNRKIDLHI